MGFPLDSDSWESVLDQHCFEWARQFRELVSHGRHRALVQHVHSHCCAWAAFCEVPPQEERENRRSARRNSGKCSTSTVSSTIGGTGISPTSDALDHCAGHHNPSEAIPRDAALIGLSDDWSFVTNGKAPCCWTLHLPSESGRLRNPHTSAHVPGTAPGPHNGAGPGGIGKAVFEGLFNDTDRVA